MTAARTRESRNWVQTLSRWSGPIVLVGLFTYFSISLPEIFPTSTNLEGMAAAQAIPGMLALAILLPVLAGEFDFSAGAVLGGAVVMVAVLTGEASVPWVPACLITLACAAGVGVINGLLITMAEVNSFVATLAVGGIIGGATLYKTGGQTLIGIPEGLTEAGQNEAVGLPLPIIYLFVVTLVVWYLLRQTPWGRRQEAIGKGRRAAELAGAPVHRQIMLSFVGSAMLAALAGILQVAVLGSAPAGLGPALLLSAYATVFLGATMFRPGFFNVPGTIVALFVIAVGINGLTLSGVNTAIEQIFSGGILIIAVVLSRLETVRLRLGRRRRAIDLAQQESVT